MRGHEADSDGMRKNVKAGGREDGMQTFQNQR
jgi:hypothetical protein